MRFLLFICLLLLPVKGFAHPHVWADTQLELLVEGRQITGLRVRWVFDELYSASFLVEADSNQNKELDILEAAQVVKEVFEEGQRDLYSFMLVKSAQEERAFTLENARIWMEDELLHYVFDIVLEVPVPLSGQHKFATYDPSFYVAFEQDLEMKLPADVQCEQKLAGDASISIYMGLVNPETYTLSCL
ncbi:MAG: DUF1007 family protein [Alphaproteobacteria bacterium]|nr:DUF1007 family protein [Alphaproteobacteria bacterium]MDD9920609.1 DUF1007 family protein [Alphaproteobacteria bacterium]